MGFRIYGIRFRVSYAVFRDRLFRVACSMAVYLVFHVGWRDCLFDVWCWMAVCFVFHVAWQQRRSGMPRARYEGFLDFMRKRS